MQAEVGDCPHNQMAEPYSNDLRRKFFQAYERGEGSLKELGKRFGVSEDWAKKLSARRSKTGRIEIGAWRHGPQSRVTAAIRQIAELDPACLVFLDESRVTAAIREWMERQIRRQPDLTLQQLQQRLEREQQLQLSVGWIWTLLLYCGDGGCGIKKIAPRTRAGHGRKYLAPPSVAGANSGAGSGLSGVFG
jgi:transposase